jgi:hypothetical protein
VGPDATILNHLAAAGAVRHADTPDLASAHQGHSAQLVLTPVRSLTDIERPSVDREVTPMTSDLPLNRQERPPGPDDSVTSRRTRVPPDM